MVLTRTRYASLVVALIWTSVTHASPDDPIRAGASAPEIRIDRYLRAPENAPRTLGELRGRWVMLDFFATWCPACSGNVDHMNQLAGSIPTEELVVISICADGASTAERFLERRPLRTWVALDDGGSTTAAYQIGGYPQAVLIDPEGTISSVVRPDRLEAGMLRSLIDGGIVAMPDGRVRAIGDEANPDWDATTSVREASGFAHAVLGYSSAERGRFLRFRDTPGRILGDGIGLDALLEHAYGISSYQLENRIESPLRYKVSVAAPVESDEAARRVLRGLLESSFGYQPDWETREVECVVLKFDADGGNGAFKAADGDADAGGFAGRAGFHLTDAPIGFITDSLARYAFGMPVLDETGLDGLFDLDADWDPRDPDSVFEALRGVGLIAERAKRPTRVLIVDPIQP
jgi:uncharacterized protein (TIGR03435 family)